MTRIRKRQQLTEPRDYTGVLEMRDKQPLQKGDQDGRVGNTEFISPHKCIKNTATIRTILTERLRKASRGPWTPERTNKIPTGGAGQKRERKKTGSRTGPALLGRGEELKEKRKSRTWGSPLTSREISRGRKGALGLAAECSNWSVTGRQSETYPDGASHSPAHPSRKCGSARVDGGGGWNVGFGEQTRVEGCCWL